MFQSGHWLCLQPIQALEHPSIQELIGVASWAKHGIDIPGWKSMCSEILNMFKEYITCLRTELNVSVTLPSSSLFLASCHASRVVKSLDKSVNMQCVASQQHQRILCHHGTLDEGDHTDKLGYQQCADLFTQLNNAHVGIWLGQVLFKIVKWVSIENKVCHYALICTITLTSSLFTHTLTFTPGPACPHLHHHAYIIPNTLGYWRSAMLHVTMRAITWQLWRSSPCLENVTGKKYDWKED